MIEFLFAIALGVGSVVLATISLGELVSNNNKYNIHIPNVDKLSRKGIICLDDNYLSETGIIKGNSSDKVTYLKTNKLDCEYITFAINPDKISNIDKLNESNYITLKLDKNTNEYVGNTKNDEFITAADIIQNKKRNIIALRNEESS